MPEAHELYAFDAAWIAERGSGGPLAGADEAGRGAFAGPIFAAAVVLGAGEIEGIKDSKLLSADARGLLFSGVIGAAEAVSLVSYPAWWIDAHGLGRANREALTRALELVSDRAGCLLADGKLRIGGAESLPRADGSSAAVAAASIVAKVMRDHAMTCLASVYPAYGFERHKGYGTAQHRAALMEVGPCRVHRLSYRGVGA
ncbi:ribonuclease HII [Rubrobacter indicoceani]|uniref:ribonuclease HII n=1 Tax=Rubrobacter indicoceani TaxID=2051957 RepID=UPI0013C40964|nr:ribonuclease HII [Rubrobacter indicoceani]